MDRLSRLSSVLISKSSSLSWRKSSPHNNFYHHCSLIMSYGRLIPSLWSRKHAHYGFVNETAIRVGASLMFTIGFFTFLSVYYAGKYNLALVVVGCFWIDFVLKVINPQFSPIAQIAKFLVRHKDPVWVGAIQKRFARTIGLILSSIVFSALIYRVIIIGDLSHIAETLSRPMYICMICLVFMRLEAVLWLCAWCHIFSFLVKHKFLRNSDHQTCPDDQCSL